MSWNTISSDDVLGSLTPVEVATLQNIQGATDGLDNVLARVIKRVRGQIKAGGNGVDQTSQDTIPDQLADEVIAIARWKWLNDFPGLKAFKTDDRKTAASDAESLMREIASSKPDRPRVELPAVDDKTASPGTSTQKASGNRRKATSCKLNGLV